MHGAAQGGAPHPPFSVEQGEKARRAAQRVREGKTTVSRAAREGGVSRTTVYRYLRDPARSPHSTSNPRLTSEEEKELKERALAMMEAGNGLTAEQFCAMARDM